MDSNIRLARLCAADCLTSVAIAAAAVIKRPALIKAAADVLEAYADGVAHERDALQALTCMREARRDASDPKARALYAKAATICHAVTGLSDPGEVYAICEQAALDAARITRGKTRPSDLLARLRDKADAHAAGLFIPA